MCLKYLNDYKKWSFHLVQFNNLIITKKPCEQLI